MGDTVSVLILLESNTTGTGRQFARAATALGIRPVLVCADPARYPWAASDGVEHVLADTADGAATLAAVRALGWSREIAGVTSSSDYYVAAAATIARALGRPGPSAAAIGACQDKGLQRRRLAAANVPVPRFAVVDSVRDAVSAAARIGYPAVLKPVQGSGSRGVRLCADRAEVAGHAAMLLSTGTNERGIPIPRRILVEAYLTGSEFSVEVFGDRAVAVVGKHLGPEPHFVETGHDLPARIPGPAAERLAACAVGAVRGLGLGWGASHAELRMDGAEVRVVEVNARLAGGMIPELVRRARGIDLVAAQVAVAAGRRPELAATARRGAAIRFLTAEHAGVLRGGDAAAAAARRVGAVADAVLYRPDGTAIGPAADFSGRLGHVIAVAADAAAAAGAADRGLAELRAAAVPTGAAAAWAAIGRGDVPCPAV
jgi:argininosuccinate lyase